MKQKITVSLEENLVRNIDQRRGDISRSCIIGRALSIQMGDRSVSEKVGNEP